MHIAFTHFVFIVVILIIADNSTVADRPIVCQIKEEQPANKLICSVAKYFVNSVDSNTDESNRIVEQSAKDANSQIANANQGYGIIGHINISRIIKIDSNSGDILTATKIDVDVLRQEKDFCDMTSQQCVISFRVLLRGPKSDPMMHAKIEITDINDNTPRFTSDSFDLEISEFAKESQQFTLPTATDNDYGQNNILKYVLESPQSDHLFTIKQERLGGDNFNVFPSLSLLKKLDREQTANYTLKLIAFDGGSPQLSGSIILMIKVKDENDHSPVVKSKDRETISEDIAVPSVIHKLLVTDEDTGANAKHSFYLHHQASVKIKQLFSVDVATGDVSVIKPLDYDRGDTEYVLPIVIADQGTVPNSVTTSLTVRIEDVNDEAPLIKVFSIKESILSSNLSIIESTDGDSSIAFVTVTDYDAGQNGVVACSVQNSHFYLKPRLSGVSNSFYTNDREKEYDLMCTSKLDREIDGDVQTVIITCHDQGGSQSSGGSRSVSEVVIVNILDINDMAPVFQRQEFYVNITENAPAKTFIAIFTAHDADGPANNKLTYSIDESSQANFIINERTGELYSKVAFDREKKESLTLQLTASDSGQPSLKGVVHVVVKILDQNDCAPKFQQAKFSFVVSEEQPENAYVGIVVAIDEDIGDNGKFFYQIRDTKALGYFNLDRSSGRLTTKKKLDREKTDKYMFDIYAVDYGLPRKTSEAKVEIEVDDENDHNPRFMYPSKLNDSIVVSYRNDGQYKIATILATDADSGENSRLLFFIDKGNERGLFELDPTTGELFVSKQLDKSDEKDYRLYLKVKDNGSPSREALASMKVSIQASSFAGNLNGDDKQQQLGGITGNKFERSVVLIISLVIIATILVVMFLFLIFCIMRKKPGNGRNGNHRDMNLAGKTNFMKKDVGDHVRHASLNSLSKKSMYLNSADQSAVIYSGGAKASIGNHRQLLQTESEENSANFGDLLEKQDGDVELSSMGDLLSSGGYNDSHNYYQIQANAPDYSNMIYTVDKYTNAGNMTPRTTISAKYYANQAPYEYLTRQPSADNDLGTIINKNNSKIVKSLSNDTTTVAQRGATLRKDCSAMPGTQSGFINNNNNVNIGTLNCGKNFSNAAHNTVTRNLGGPIDLLNCNTNIDSQHISDDSSRQQMGGMRGYSQAETVSKDVNNQKKVYSVLNSTFV